jgi:uncharacterized membrane protein
MTRSQRLATAVFAIGIIGLGILALVYGDFALVWQPVAPWFPGRTALAYLSGILMLLCGAGLFFKPTFAWSVRILFPYLVLWTLLKVPALFAAPKMEAVWLGIGELAVLLSGGWVLFATLSEPGKQSGWRFFTGQTGIRTAQILFGLALLPIGLAHLVYAKETAALVPAWLLFQLGLTYFTGVTQIACGFGVLFNVLPGLAATIEAVLLSLFALLVWGPVVVVTPTTRMPWTAFLISWVIAGSAWIVAAYTTATKSHKEPK